MSSRLSPILSAAGLQSSVALIFPSRDADETYNRIEADHAALKQVLRPKRSFRKLTAAKNTLKGIETHRAIKKGHFANNETGVLNEISFVANLFKKSGMIWG